MTYPNFQHAWHLNSKLKDHFIKSGDNLTANQYAKLKDYAIDNLDLGWSYEYDEETGNVIYPADFIENSGMIACKASQERP